MREYIYEEIKTEREMRRHEPLQSPAQLAEILKKRVDELVKAIRSGASFADAPDYDHVLVRDRLVWFASFAAEGIERLDEERGKNADFQDKGKGY